MSRTTIAALSAGILLIVSAGSTAANDGPCNFGYPGCWGCCLRLFPHIHQHGPLYNYGPYYGYPPFEPYGYWNAYLQYTGPVPQPDYAGGGGAKYGWINGPGGGHAHALGGGLLHSGGCASCGGGHIHGHKGGCKSCGATAANYLNSGNALDRYTGVGEPAASMAFYAQSAGSVITVGYPGR